MIHNISNKFWINVFEAWLQVLDKLKYSPYYNSDLSPIWYNPCISRQKLFFKHWFDKGIIFVTDLLDENGNFQSIENPQVCYNMTTINFLDYLSVKFAIKNFLSVNKPSEAIKIVTRPKIPDFYSKIKRARKYITIFSKTKV